MEHERQRVKTGEPVTHTDIVSYCAIQENLEEQVGLVEAVIADLEMQTKVIDETILELRERVSKLDQNLPDVPWNPIEVNAIETSDIRLDIFEKEAAQGVLEQELAIKRSELLRLQKEIAALDSIINGSNPESTQ